MVVEKICKQLGVDEEEVTLNAEIRDDLGADSLDVVEIIMALEEELKIEIPDDDVAKLDTPGQIFNYLAGCLGIPPQ